MTAAAGLITPLAMVAPQASADVGGQQIVDVANCNMLGALQTDYYSQVTRAPQHSRLPDEVHYLASNIDGEKIQVGIVRPDVPAGVLVPVILVASPYLGPDMAHYPLEQCSPRLVNNYVAQGYAVAFLPVRGYGGSGGCPDMMGPKERSDVNQAVTWLAKRPWSNGSIGMVGLSYDGATPWEVASTGNPHLKTIVPISGVNDLFDLMFGEGVSDSRGTFIGENYRAQIAIPFKNPLWGTNVEGTYDNIDCPALLEYDNAALHAQLTGERDPGGFWAARNTRPGVAANYHGSILLAQGLQDWNVDPNHQFPWIDTLPHRIVVKKVLGQWGHSNPDGQPAESAPRWPCHRDDWADVLLNWFDRYLKADTTVDTGPAVQVQDSTMQWRNAAVWPPADVPATQLQLTSAGTLSATPDATPTQKLVGPAADNLVERQVTSTDWACAELKRTPPTAGLVANFSTPPYISEYRFAGIPVVDLTVTPTGDAGHLNGFLYSEAPDGTTLQLGWGQVDLRFPQGGEKARKVVPGAPIAVKLPIQPLDAVVHPGSRLRLILAQGSDSDHLPSLANYPVHVTLGGAASTLTLPETAPPSTDFFSPPRP